MAILKAEVQFNFKGIQELARIYPDLNYGFLALVGKRSRTLLKMEAIANGINLTEGRANTRSGKPPNKIMSDVQKSGKVKVYAFPLMLFEGGRTLRDGSRQKAVKVYPKLKQSVMSRMGTYIRQFENEILEPGIKKAGL